MLCPGLGKVPCVKVADNGPDSAAPSAMETIPPETIPPSDMPTVRMRRSVTRTLSLYCVAMLPLFTPRHNTVTSLLYRGGQAITTKPSANNRQADALGEFTSGGSFTSVFACSAQPGAHSAYM